MGLDIHDLLFRAYKGHHSQAGRDGHTNPTLVTRLGSAWSQICSWLTEASPIVGKRRLIARWADSGQLQGWALGTKPCSVTTSCKAEVIDLYDSDVGDPTARHRHASRKCCRSGNAARA